MTQCYSIVNRCELFLFDLLMCSLFVSVCDSLCLCQGSLLARNEFWRFVADVQAAKFSSNRPFVERNVTCFNRFKVFCPTVETIKLQTSKWMLWAAMDANKTRLYLNCEPDLLTCASLNCGIYKSAQNKHLRCITSKRRLRVWKKKKQEDCNQIHSMAMAHHKNVEFSESFVATGVNGVPKPESCTHILHRMKLTLQGLAW